MIDPTYLPSESVVSGNLGGGGSIIDPIGMIDPTYTVPPTTLADPTYAATLKGVDVAENHGFGMVVFGGNVHVSHSAIWGTKKSGVFGDGLVLTDSNKALPGLEAAGSEVTATVAVASNARSGMIVTR